MKILGIETSCDETAASVVEDGKILLSNVIASSVDLHAAYGGVVPEIAARSHLESILPVIDEAVKEVGWDNIDAIAVIQGPGLSGSLIIGVMTARTLAIAKQKPLYAIDHVHAHVYAAFLTEKANSLTLKAYSLPKEQPRFPLLALIISGGHTQLVFFRDHFKYTVLGQTVDDAVGEAFDKVAKILGLPYPGGPAIAKVAERGNPKAIKLPKAKFDVRKFDVRSNVRGLTSHTKGDYRFSFSGLKTAVLRASQAIAGKDFTLPSHELAGLLSGSQKDDIAASFQRTALETLITPVKIAVEEFKPTDIVVAGGVAANSELRRLLSESFENRVIYTDMKLCTDNAAMIAVLGFYKASLGQPAADPYSLEIDPNLQM
ncbi:tRNA (adenosine(37)-N6)-threonylcarbamoyltransferase complex transferase subunit TsaD [Candidatus Saccharibacteria bacterium CG10_big_fil_rev_8_21_14_0_10_47_8]|nr:MAG: tRNA (adenosine(37)-N6)-threonylcarbamoyltransferase complex transferase subunit TsaD [Candidatus Saccharibacteria bacterium CG10_big_fil_rev_8_21_14_0_10_47_8]